MTHEWRRTAWRGLDGRAAVKAVSAMPPERRAVARPAGEVAGDRAAEPPPAAPTRLVPVRA
jgi:hypothetical protein